MNRSNYIVAVEIGSSKIKGAVGKVDSAGILTVKGIEEEHQHPNHVRHGCVQNVKEVANELNRVITKLNNYISPAKISAVYLGVGGRSMKSVQTKVQMALADDTEITHEIVDSLLERAVVIDSSTERLAIEPVEYRVNGKIQSDEPVGNLGHELSATVNIVSCRNQLLRNLKLSVSEKLNLPINGYIVRPMALADLVMNSEERRTGAMLVDCGAETTTVAIYKGGRMRYLATIPLGSRHITRDLTSMFPLEERAEEVKCTVGDAHPETSASKQPEEIDNAKINKIVVARASEIIANIGAQVNYAGMTVSDLPGGIIIVGGGAMLKGFAEALAQTTNMSVRRGSLPTTVRLAGNKISTAEDLDVISLLYYLAHRENISPCTQVPAPPAPPVVNTGSTNSASAGTTTAGTTTAAGQPAEPDDFEDEEDEDLPGDIEPMKTGFWKSLKSKFSNLGTSASLDAFDD
ncbi:MAG: cell division protein FtsA [Bacteroides sp.]|nr:cell division protein FtsA [Bacteroidales bacterium]MBD5327111.1 cell division protein FtsA [Bacteroides sp.]MBD5415592.1 cell division protein FtsA [Bacteroides sp.]MDE6222987.1 cell division protein FtsA [Muribaculaceae bacterium]MDE6818177.1 cell division protein FtsA [Muribaculaceae bacterium]